MGFFKKKKENMTGRKELITDPIFCDRFFRELKQYAALEHLHVSPSLPSSDIECIYQTAIPLLMFSDSAVGAKPYHELLLQDSKLWENLTVDDSLQIIAEEIEALPLTKGSISLFFTNDCSALDKSYKQTFGLSIELRDCL